MFNFLDSCTLICGGDIKATNPTPVPENEVTLEQDKNDVADEEILLVPVDPMDTKNYLVVQLERPMGILFEENYEERYGGAFVAEINEGCSAAADGSICRGDQLIAIGEKRVSGMDFGEVMKLILDSVEEKTKLTLFRGPAESLYGPSGASIEWLDEFVAERGEEAALVEEDSDSDLAVAVLDADVLDETFEAYQTLLDVETNVEQEVDATDKVSVAAENEVTDSETKEENASAMEVSPCENEVVVDGEAENTMNVVADAGSSDIANEVNANEVMECENESEKEAIGANVVEADDDEDEEVSDNAVPETDESLLHGAVNKASKDWLDNYLANPESQLVSDQEENDAAQDLEARCKKAAEVKEAALTVDVGKEKFNTKGILKESKYSPKGVDDVKIFDSNPSNSNESLDEDSAASSVWSEPEDFIGQVTEEVPVKRVGSSLAAMGVASTLTTQILT